MAAAISIRSADGLTHWEEAVGGRQTTRSGTIALAVTIEATHE